MTLNTNNKLATVPERVIPQFIYESYPEYVEIVTAYFDYLDRIDTSVSPVDIGEYSKVQNLLKLRDIDETLDDFLDQFRFTHASLLPKNMAVDFRFIVKMIKSFYATKGSEESFKLFFEMVFNADVEFVYPKENLLRASDGKWTDPRYILPDPDTIGAAIPGSPTLAEETAFVDLYVQGQYPLVGLESDASGVGEEYINILAEPNARVISLSNVSGTFQPNEYFYPLGLRDPLDDPNYNPLKQQEWETLTQNRDVKLSIRDGYTVDTPAWNTAHAIYLTAQSELDTFESTLFYMAKVNQSETLSSDTITLLTRTSRRVILKVPVSSFENGDNVEISGAENPNYNGIHKIYTIDATDSYFDLTTDEAELPVTITQAAGLATVSHTSHPYKTGDTIKISGADQAGYNLDAIITSTGVNSYTYSVDAGTVSPATGTITARLIAEIDAGVSITVLQVKTGATWQDGYIADQDGYWANDDGKVSHVMILQDSDFWQDFSYLLKSEIHISNFLEPILTNLHPAGFKLFSELIAGDGVLITGAKPKLVPEIIINGESFGLIEWLIEWMIELFGLDALTPVLGSQIMVIEREAAYVTTWGDLHNTRRWFEQQKENPEYNMGQAIGDLDELPIDYFDNAHGHALTFISGYKIHVDEYDVEKDIWLGTVPSGERFNGVLLEDGLLYGPDIYDYQIAATVQKTTRAWSASATVAKSLIFADGLEMKSSGIGHFASNVSGTPSTTGNYLNITTPLADGTKIEICRLVNLTDYYTSTTVAGNSVEFSPPFPMTKGRILIFADGKYIPESHWKREGNRIIGLYGTTFVSGKMTAYYFSNKITKFEITNLGAADITSYVLPTHESHLNLIANEIVITGP